MDRPAARTDASMEGSRSLIWLAGLAYRAAMNLDRSPAAAGGSAFKQGTRSRNNRPIGFCTARVVHVAYVPSGRSFATVPHRQAPVARFQTGQSRLHNSSRVLLESSEYPRPLRRAKIGTFKIDLRFQTSARCTDFAFDPLAVTDFLFDLKEEALLVATVKLTCSKYRNIIRNFYLSIV